MTNKYPQHIMAILRQRHGLEADDASQDEHLNRIAPLDALREAAGWRLGDTSWADNFIDWANAVGLKVVDKNGNEIEPW